MPSVLKDKVSVDQPNWVAFMKAIKDINPVYIAEKVKQELGEKAQEEVLEARIVRIEGNQR